MSNLGLTLAFLPKAPERCNPTSSGNHDHLSYKTLDNKDIVEGIIQEIKEGNDFEPDCLEALAA